MDSTPARSARKSRAQKSEADEIQSAFQPIAELIKKLRESHSAPASLWLPAIATGLTNRQLTRVCQRERLPYSKLGKSTFVRRDSWEAYLDAKSSEAVDADVPANDDADVAARWGLDRVPSRKAGAR
jgi:hypothetical protein